MKAGILFTALIAQDAHARCYKHRILAEYNRDEAVYWQQRGALEHKRARKLLRVLLDAKKDDE